MLTLLVSTLHESVYMKVSPIYSLLLYAVASNLWVLIVDPLDVLQDKDLEVCAVNLKLDQLEAELQDLNSQESKDEASLAKVFPLSVQGTKNVCKVLF